MAHRMLPVRTLLVSTLALLLGSACGGSENAEGGDNGGTTGSAGARPSSGGGGSTAAGGNSALAGNGALAGSTASGGSIVSGGTGNGGGPASSAGSNANGGSTSGGSTSGGGSANGGAANGGSSANGGSKNGGAASGGSANGGSGGTVGADQCKPVGWATRTARTGSAASVTGGGNATPTVVKSFADLAKYAADGQARVIHVDGTLGSGWSGTSGDRLEIKSNKTIVGLRAGTQLKAAIHISGASNVILRNLVVRGPGSNEDQAWDNLNIEGASKNIWVDHCEFWDGQDGNADVVKGADTVTFTWNIFGYSIAGHSHNLSNLIASSDDEPASEGKLDITYMFNWWKAAAQRQPRCRYGQIHVVNNLYTGDNAIGASVLGVSNGYSCNVLTENNHFINQGQPIDLGKEDGPGSVQQAVGNLFENCTGNQKGSGTAFTPPYEYKSFMVPATEVKALVQKSAGATLSSPSACQ